MILMTILLSDLKSKILEFESKKFGKAKAKEAKNNRDR